MLHALVSQIVYNKAYAKQMSTPLKQNNCLLLDRQTASWIQKVLRPANSSKFTWFSSALMQMHIWYLNPTLHWTFIRSPANYIVIPYQYTSANIVVRIRP